MRNSTSDHGSVGVIEMRKESRRQPREYVTIVLRGPSHIPVLKNRDSICSTAEKPVDVESKFLGVRNAPLRVRLLIPNETIRNGEFEERVRRRPSISSQVISDFFHERSLLLQLAGTGLCLNGIAGMLRLFSQ